MFKISVSVESIYLTVMGSGLVWRGTDTHISESLTPKRPQTHYLSNSDR